MLVKAATGVKSLTLPMMTQFTDAYMQTETSQGLHRSATLALHAERGQKNIKRRGVVIHPYNKFWFSLIWSTCDNYTIQK